MFEVGEVYRYDTFKEAYIEDTHEWVDRPIYIDIVVMGREQYKGHRYLLQFMRIGEEGGEIESILIHPGMISKFKLLENPDEI